MLAGWMDGCRTCHAFGLICPSNWSIGPLGSIYLMPQVASFLFCMDCHYNVRTCSLNIQSLLVCKTGLSSVVNATRRMTSALVACSGVVQPSWANDHAVYEGKFPSDKTAPTSGKQQHTHGRFSFQRALFCVSADDAFILLSIEDPQQARTSSTAGLKLVPTGQGILSLPSN